MRSCNVPPQAPAMLRRLQRVKAPRVLLRVVVLLLVAHLVHDTPICSVDALETFAGVRAVTRAFCARGLNAVAFELDLHKLHHDFLTAHGFLHVLWLSLILADGAMAMHAPVCSTWVWVSRAVTRRCLVLPLGDVAVPCVAAANAMVSRLVLLILVNLAKKVWVLIEQPLNSILEYHPRFQWLLQEFRWWKVNIEMGSYGADTQKPTVLYSSEEFAGEITGLRTRWWDKSMSTGSLVTTATRNGKIAVSGIKDKIKASQGYPAGFADAVADTYMRHKAGLKWDAMKADAEDSQDPIDLKDLWADVDGEDLWDDAWTADLLHYLRTGEEVVYDSM